MWWKFDKKLDRIIDEQREIDKRLDNIEKVMLVQENNLQVHMKRSDHLEEIVQNLRDKDLKRVNRHVAMVEGALKVFGGIGVLVSILGLVFKVMGII